jgi:serine protease Do
MYYEEKRKRPVPAIIAFVLGFALLFGGAGGLLGHRLTQQTAEPAASVQPPAPAASPYSPIPAPAVGTSTGNELTIQELFILGNPSAVAIATVSGGGTLRSSRESAGSGFVLSSDGYILTNHHVVEGASDITVLFSDGSEAAAEIAGGDSVTDVAVLKVDLDGLTPVRLGNSDGLMVGDKVAAIGNPLGELSNSLTVGYISATQRIVEIDRNVPRLMLQTDASVSPGNSGGPLFNIYGEVIGVVTAKTVASGVEGIGFAIPVNIAIAIADELLEHGEIFGRPILGVTASDSDNTVSPKGAYISEVTADGPADKGGIEQGDVITRLNGENVRSLAELLLSLNNCRVGSTVPVTVWRDGEELELSVKLDTERPKQQEETSRPPLIPWGR